MYWELEVQARYYASAVSMGYNWEHPDFTKYGRILKQESLLTTGPGQGLYKVSARAALGRWNPVLPDIGRAPWNVEVTVTENYHGKQCLF